jgi:hypothetical protein
MVELEDPTTYVTYIGTRYVIPEGGWHEDWKTSEAKGVLAALMKDGTITNDMVPSQVYPLDARFWKYNPANFSNNFRTLRKVILLDKERVAFDRLAVTHDSLMHPKETTTSNGNLRWDGSNAQVCLKERLKEPRFVHFLGKKNPMPSKVRNDLYLEDFDVNKDFGYARWSKFLTQYLEPKQSQFLAKKKLGIGSHFVNEKAGIDQGYLF